MIIKQSDREQQLNKNKLLESFAKLSADRE